MKGSLSFKRYLNEMYAQYDGTTIDHEDLFFIIIFFLSLKNHEKCQNESFFSIFNIHCSLKKHLPKKMYIYVTAESSKKQEKSPFGYSLFLFKYVNECVRYSKMITKANYC